MAVNDPKSRDTRQRLEKCWSEDVNWELLPVTLKKGCVQLGKALCVPPAAVLGGLVIITSYVASPAVVTVPKTNWSEPALVWLCINMPTGSTKSALYQYLHGIIIQVRKACGYAPRDPAWLLGDATCEKMGDLMAANGGRLLGLYDELSTFLTQLNLYRGKGLTLTHELAVFLQLFNGHSWTRTTVTGEANFSMDKTCLTVGGFSQPSVARTLIEQSTSAEVGLTQRFLWTFPKPTYSRFGTLEEVDENFTDSIVNHLKKLWKPGRTKNPTPRILKIKQNSEAFTKHFDCVQAQLETLASMDDLLSGMLSKSKGQILRVAAAFHFLFGIGRSDPSNEQASENMDKDEISEEAVIAAIDFVELCCQQTAFMAGRGNITEEIQLIKASIIGEEEKGAHGGDMTPAHASRNTPAHCLLLPGRRLDLKALLKKKKFRDPHGYKKGALAAFSELEQAGLGVGETVNTKYGTEYFFEKAVMPDTPEEKADFARKLMKYNVSLLEYSQALQQEEIRSPKPTMGKRKISETDEMDLPRRSPRKSPRKDLSKQN